MHQGELNKRIQEAAVDILGMGAVAFSGELGRDVAPPDDDQALVAAIPEAVGLAFELLHDADGTGTLDSSLSGGSHGYPAWARQGRPVAKGAQP